MSLLLQDVVDRVPSQDFYCLNPGPLVVFRLVYHKFAFDAKLAQNQLNVQEARA